MMITVESVDGTLVATLQDCGLDLLIITGEKNMDQGKKEVSTSTQETVWEL